MKKLLLILGLLLLGATGAYFSGGQNTHNIPKLPVFNEPDPITLVAVGDINLGRKTGQEILKEDIDFPFQFIRDELSDADITFGNLESQLRDTGGVTQSPANEYTFSGPLQGAMSLKNAGIDIVSIANNHMWDYGQDGLRQTLETLDTHGIKHIGASLEPDSLPDYQLYELKGQKIAILAVTDLLNGYEKVASPYVAMTNNTKLEARIKELRPQVDWLLLSLHMGTEYQTKPNQRQIDFTHRMVDLGVDMVIGHHPHVRQTIEGYNGKIIVYSLGNFAFWQPFTKETQTGTMLNITFTNAREMTFRAYDIAAGWQPKMMDNPDPQTGGITRPAEWKRSDEVKP